MKFNEGDRVVAIKDEIDDVCGFLYLEGTVVHLTSNNDYVHYIGVQFDNPESVTSWIERNKPFYELHDCNGLGEDGKCWYCAQDEIELIEDPVLEFDIETIFKDGAYL